MGVPCDEILGNDSKGLPECFYTLWAKSERSTRDAFNQWQSFHAQRAALSNSIKGTFSQCKDCECILNDPLHLLGNSDG